MDEPTLLNHLRTLVDTRLITAASPEAFEFRHALTREAVYSTLLKRQRVVYHGLVADILEAQNSAAGPGAARAADLAFHYREAGNWPKALAYAQQAGEQAQKMYASREAAEHFSHALTAAAQLGQAPNPGLLRGRGQAYETLGEFEAARADYEHGLSAARAAGAARAEWQALLDLGFLWAGRDYARTGDYFQQTLALAPSIGDPLAVAQSLNRLGNWLVNTGRVEAGLPLHAQALAIFKAQGSAEGMAATHDLLALSYGFSGNVAASIEHAEQAVSLFRQAGNKPGLIASLGNYNSLAHTGDVLPWAALLTLPYCRQLADEAVDLVREIGWLAGLAEVQWLSSLTLAIFGQLGEALAWANDALRTASDIDHRQWIAAGHFVLGYVYLLLLEPDTAASHLEAARGLGQALGSTWWIGYSVAFLAFARVLQGRAPEAQAELQSAAAAMGLPAGWMMQIPQALIQRYLIWAWGETALAQGQPAEALAVAERLIDSAINPDGRPLPHLLKFKAEALMALGHLVEAEGALSQAAEAARQNETRPILWQIEAARARLATLQGRPAEAQQAREAAQAVMEDLANTLDPPLRDGFRARSLGQLIRVNPPWRSG